ncbi:hypothetical protein PUN28_016720 [Cardiocondyla obscurior]|uniref:Uncharacterized protein n=1 Tax=Cardiocondyla obscurior TaxID=286306 RepID=A0AAW2EPM8_9HYME
MRSVGEHARPIPSARSRDECGRQVNTCWLANSDFSIAARRLRREITRNYRIAHRVHSPRRYFSYNRSEEFDLARDFNLIFLYLDSCERIRYRVCKTCANVNASRSHTVTIDTYLGPVC